MSEFHCNATVNQISVDLRLTQIECRKRGLIETATWLAEMRYALDLTGIASTSGEEKVPDAVKCCYIDGISENERDEYNLARGYFDLREYDRAAHCVRNAESPVAKFLHLYSLYKAKEKRRIDNLTDRGNLVESGQYIDLADLKDTLYKLHAKRKLDGYCLYLYGLVLKKLDVEELAEEVLIESINAVPTLWCSYAELAPLLNETSKIYSIKLPDHWMRGVFFAFAHVELLDSDTAITLLTQLQKTFVKSTFLVAQIGKALHYKRSVDQAIEQYELLLRMDPYRLEDLDIYSNLLFVSEKTGDMAVLAHNAMDINKHRAETNCLIGNYYSIRGKHHNSVLYFQRSLKVDPTFLSSWILLGHEFMELRNYNAAIQSYRKAIELNHREYRAWYGLGQAYEILKVHPYSLLYYKKAQELRPDDNRMLIALGEMYEKVNQHQNALACYRRVYNAGNPEDITLLRLGNLHETMGNIDAAVPIYVEFCSQDRIINNISSRSQYLLPLQARAYRTLARHYQQTGDLDKAKQYAKQCLTFELKPEYDTIKAEAQTILDAINNIGNPPAPEETVAEEPAADETTADEPTTDDDTPSSSSPSTASTVRRTIPHPTPPMDLSMDMEIDENADGSTTDSLEDE